MLPDSAPLTRPALGWLWSKLRWIHWEIFSRWTKKGILSYLQALSAMREGDRWWEYEVGFTAKVDSAHSERLCAIYMRRRVGGRGKGDDLDDKSEVKSANTPSTVDTQRFTAFNGINSVDSEKRLRARKLFSAFLDERARTLFVIIDHPAPDPTWDGSWIDRLRVRIYLVDNQFDAGYREYVLDGLAKRGVTKIQLHIDDSNRANGRGLESWRLDPEGVVGDLSEPEVFTSSAGSIILPKVLEAVEVDRDTGEWTLELVENPHTRRDPCRVGANFRLDTPNRTDNPWSAVNLRSYLEELQLSSGQFTEDELREILAGEVDEEWLAGMDLQQLRGTCQKLELPRYHDAELGRARFLGQRYMTKTEILIGRGIDHRAAMLWRLQKAGHELFSWAWIHELFLGQHAEEE